MAKPMSAPKGIHEIDFRVIASALASVFVYTLVTTLISAAADYLNLCIMTICCAFIADESAKVTFKSAVTRFELTSIGAISAVIPLLAYDYIWKNEIFFAIVFAAVLLLPLVLCKLFNVMYIQIRTATVSYVLSAYTFHGAMYEQMGKTGYKFVLMWIVSTILGGAIACLVTCIFDTVKKMMNKQ